jgi:hypothetical protein
MGTGICWERSYGKITFSVSGSYFIPINVEQNPSGLMDNLLPYSGLDMGLRIGRIF